MRNRILMSSAALMLVMGTASLAQTERRDPAQSPPAAQQGEQSAPDAQKGRASQPGAQQQQMQQQQKPRAQDQKGSQQPSTAQDQKARPQRDQTTGQAPRSGQQDQPTRAQDQKAPPQPGAQDRTAPQQPSAQRPARGDQPSSAQAPADRQGTDVKISKDQETQISQRLASRDVHRIDRSRVNFNIAVGTAVPASVRFVPLPSTIVAIVPQYRGYHYVVVEDEIVIIEPRTRRIVHVMPFSGGSRAAVTKRKVSMSDANRDYVRTTVKARPRAAETTGTGITEIVVGDTLPETVVIERFPDPVYRRVPVLRSYQYIQRNDDIYLVDRNRRVIEMFD
jgi:hypothetical protein